MTRYVVNTIPYLVTVDSDTVAVISTKKRFCIRGTNISDAVQNIIDHFKNPIGFYEVVSILSTQYSAGTLEKMIELFIDNNILISEKENAILKKHNNMFLEKTFFYTLGGKSLQEIITQLSSIYIGIIGTDSLVSCLLDNLISSGLISKFNVGITNKEIGTPIVRSGITIKHYSLYADFSNIKKIVDNSDLIIVASNYLDHYLFQRINNLCFEKSKKWLRILIDGATAEVGPLFIPNESCCYECLYTRRRHNISKEEYIFDDLYNEKQFHENIMSRMNSFYSLYPINSMSLGIACSEMMKHLVGMRCNLLNQVLIVNCIDLHTQLEYIYKDYMCPVCTQA